MRNKHLFGMALAAVMTAACSFVDEPVDAPRNGGLSATVEGSRSSTRAGFAEDGAFYWSNEDYLGVTTDQCMTSFSTLELTSGGGKASATFEGPVSGEIEGYAIYPVSDDHRLSGNTLTYHLPETYTYKQVDADYFTTTQGNGNSFNPPMWGAISDNGNNKTVRLQHLGGVFCVKIPKMPLTEGTFILSADEQITGNFTADLDEQYPVIATPTGEGAATTATSAVSGNNEVTITFSEATQGSPGVFYVPVPTGTYNNVRVKVTDGTGAIAKVNAVVGTYIVKRQDLKKIEPKIGSVDATVATESESLEKAAAALASKDAVTVTSEITSSQSITIPSVSSTEATSKSLSLEKVASGASLTVTDGNKDGDATNSVDNFTLSIPNNETQGFDALDVTINMPHTTVTLAGNGGVATYGNVTASTADNTLVLSGGVKVNKVIVKKGNIRVNKGAELVAIEKDKENTAEIVTVYVEEGAKIPTLPDGFKVASDDELVTLKMTAAKGGSYTMTGDLTLDEPLVVETGVTFTLDLNGHALKANPAGLTKVLNTSDAVVLVRRGATLTIDDNSSNGQGSIDANDVSTVYGAVKLTDTNDGESGNVAKLVVNGGQLKGYYYGIVGNGTRHNTEVVVKGGKVMNTSDAGSAIYHPQVGTLTVEGGEIVGANTGIELRSGTLSISGGTISCTRTDKVIEPNGSGTTVSGAALAISQHTTNKDISVTISGGTFTGPYALYEEDLQDGEVSNIKITGVSGGTFNGKIYSENCTQFISGGTFSDPSALAYLTEKADVNVNFTGDTKLAQTIIVPKGTVTIDLGKHTLTTASTATEFNNKVTAIAVKDGAKATVKNGNIGNASAGMFYGVYAYGTANVTLENVNFSEMVTYAYNGAGKLSAEGCTFRGWLSAWHHGGTFEGCTFTIGKAWYPAAICYGSTTFTNCKFFKNGTDADEYGDREEPDSDGYYRCNYVVAGYNSATTIDFNGCEFIDENGDETKLTSSNHPYHACGWGDGKIAVAQIKVDNAEITSQCEDASQQQE